ncbi:hypothetical protein Tco_0298779 [Tanacetum coccineum]
MVKKKETIYAADHIIPDLEFALELGKSISLTENVEEEAERQVHATHERIVTESEPKPAKKTTGSRSTKGVVIQDTPSALKPKLATSKLKLKGTRVSNEGTGVSPGVLDESTVVPATSSEGTGDDEEVDWIEYDEDEEKKDDTDDDKSIDLKMNDDEETDDEFVHGDEQVNDDEDEEMLNAEVEDPRKGDAEISDVAKVDAEKIEEIKDDSKKAELPLTSSSLSLSSGFGDQFLKLSFDTSLVSTVKDITDAEINCLLGIKIQSKVLHIKYPSVLRVPVFAIFEPLVLSPIQETSTVVLITTLPLPSVSTISLVPHKTTTPIPKPPITTDAPTITTAVLESDALSAVQLRVGKLENDVSELKKIDHSTEALATLKSQVPTIVEHYHESKIDDDLQKVLQRHTADLIQKYFMKPAPEYGKIQKPTIDLE